MPLGERYLIMNSRDFRGVGEKGRLKNEMEKDRRRCYYMYFNSAMCKAKMPAGSGTNMKRHSSTF